MAYGLTSDDGTATDVAQHPAGGVIVAASLNTAPDVLRVAKLDEATGAELWRNDITTNCHVFIESERSTGGIEIDAETGAEVWRQVFANGSAAGVIADSAGGVIAVGSASPPAGHFNVVRLDAETGALLWDTEISGTAPTTLSSSVIAIAGGTDGTVNVAGYTVNVDRNSPEYSEDFTVTRLRVDGGNEISRVVKDVHTNNSPTLSARSIAVNAERRVAAVGTMLRNPGSQNWQYGLAALTVSDRLLGTKLALSDSAKDPTRRKLTVGVRDVFTLLPALQSSGDPTLNGGSIETFNPDSGDSAVIPVPAFGWSTSALDAIDHREFTYRDAKRLNGPCRQVVVTPSKVSIACRGQGIGFTLDEASQGTIGVRLTLGTSRLCREFGGEILRATSTSSGSSRTLRGAHCTAAIELSAAAVT